MKRFTIITNSDTSRYDYLSRLSDDRWAWEFARRNPALRQDTDIHRSDDVSEKQAADVSIRILRPRVVQTRAERWGLAFMPDPALNGFEADAVWSHHVFPDQVAVNCTPGRSGVLCEILERALTHCRVTHVTDRSAREYLLIRRDGCIVQIHCTGMSLLGPEPVRMKLQLTNLEDVEQKMKLLRQAIKLCGDEPMTTTPVWTKRTEVLRNGLIALDALDAGLSQRDIAVLIHGRERVAQEWDFDESALRASVRYAMTKAEGLRDGGFYKDLLGMREPFDRRTI